VLKPVQAELVMKILSQKTCYECRHNQTLTASDASDGQLFNDKVKQNPHVNRAHSANESIALFKEIYETSAGMERGICLAEVFTAHA
jgi:hypothetical protein